MIFNPREVGWRLGRALEPRGGPLWVPWDRTAGVIGPQGSGKTLDLLTPALLEAPGAALVMLTKVEDLLLSLTARARRGPCVLLDPFGLATGLTRHAVAAADHSSGGESADAAAATGAGELVWDPVAGCVDPTVAERRAKAFCAGT